MNYFQIKFIGLKWCQRETFLIFILMTGRRRLEPCFRSWISHMSSFLQWKRSCSRGFITSSPWVREGLWPQRYRAPDRVPADPTCVGKRSGETGSQSFMSFKSFWPLHLGAEGIMWLVIGPQKSQGRWRWLVFRTYHWILLIPGKSFDQANVRQEIMKVSKDFDLFVCWCLFFKSPKGRMEYLGYKVRIVFSTLAKHWSHLGSFNKTWCLDSIIDIWIFLAQGMTQEKRRIKRIIFIFRSLMSYYGAERGDMLYVSPESRTRIRIRKILRDLTQETKFSDDTRFIKLEWAS